MPSGGRRPGAGRPPGSKDRHKFPLDRKGVPNHNTGDSRIASRSYWARAARAAWLKGVDKIRAETRGKPNDRRRLLRQFGKPPDPDDLIACIDYLNSLDHAAVALAMERHDYKAAHEILEHARDRALGRAPYQLEHGGIEEGVPIAIEAAKATLYRCVLPDPDA